ncbi:MAG: cupin domain-containing protein [Dehalococcoidia bacterium]
MSKAFYNQDEVQKKELAPGVFVRPIWGEKIMMGLIDIGPGAEVPMHSHPHEQCGRVLSGAFYLTVGGETKLLREGDHYVIPGGVEHAAKGTENPSLALDIWSPPREEYKP